MKTGFAHVICIFCLVSNCFSQDKPQTDSLSGRIMQLNKEKIELENQYEELNKKTAARNLGLNFGLGGAMLGFLFMSIGFYNQHRKTRIANTNLEIAYKELKNTQEQLLKSEKMATFGVMATRLSHEILNPLNFVNNFSDLSQDILLEMKDPRNENTLQENINQLGENLKKIHEHGNRATIIVKQLQEHSTKGTAHEFFD